MELLLPAGNFQSGVAALEHGADAVYLGMTSFSARQGARNFTLDELRRLKSFATEQGKKIYIACNTVVRDAEIGELLRLLDQVAYITADGVIVQDLGVLDILTRYYPSLAVHASTQMGIHTAEGAAAAKALGIRRVILPRELRLEEIAQIHQCCPGLELEVFIHGALCYGFSGKCLASGLLLNRSANRGECGQICRTWFSLVEPVPGVRQNGFFFSMRDQAVGEGIRGLQAAGVVSCKVEGRMKSPEYAAEAASYYRKILEGRSADPAALQTIFSRATTPGWTAAQAATQPMTTPEYPGHRGITAGTVLEYHRKSGQVTVRTEVALALHDGLLVLKEGSPLPKALRFGIGSMKTVSGERVTCSRPGATVRIAVPREIAAGTVIYKTASHDQKLPEHTPEAFPLWKHPLELLCRIGKTEITVTAGSAALSFSFSGSSPVTVQPARTRKDFRKQFSEMFQTSGDNLFTADPASMQFENESGLPLEELFIPLSQLKAFRRRWYAELQEAYLAEKRDIPSPPCPEVTVPLPARASIIPRSDPPFPFITDPATVAADDLAELDGYIYIPLAPVTFESGRYLAGVEQLAARAAERFPAAAVRIGLNNPGQLTWAQRHPEHHYFADIYLYTANRFTLAKLQQLLSGTTLAYRWLEDDDASPADLEACGIFPVGSGCNPPLFISRTCFHRNADASCCRSCRGTQPPVRLRQQDRRFELHTRGCLAYLFRVE